MTQTKDTAKNLNIKLSEEVTKELRELCASVGITSSLTELVNKIIIGTNLNKKTKLAEEIKNERLRSEALKDPAVLAQLDEILKNRTKK